MEDGVVHSEVLLGTQTLINAEVQHLGDFE